jgi:hypothetical protein
MSRRNKSFVWGGVTATALFVLGIATGNILPMTIIALTGFTLVSCLILGNNFIGEMKAVTVTTSYGLIIYMIIFIVYLV